MELGRIIPVISIPISLGRSPDAVPHLQSQRAAVFVLLFALLMLLIIYSSSSGTEVFPYSALRGRARRPPNLRHWGVSSGYLPVSGNKVGTGCGCGDGMSPWVGHRKPLGLGSLCFGVSLVWTHCVHRLRA